MIRLILLCLLLSLTLTAHSQNFRTDDERNNIDVFKSASPSVVTVTNQTLVRDRFSFNLQTIPQGAGTGFIWNTQGIVVTNFHVIENARKILITLSDQTSWPAQVIGLAPEKDLAVLKIDAPKTQLTPLPLGDSSALEVGRKVLAIGNPFGLDATLTTGVVSALGREIDAPNQRKIRGVIQTDAAINPGNSGGPLLNSQGQLIGVNTMIYSPSGASAGIGFAIPVNTVATIVPQLMKHGQLVRPILGIDAGPQSWLTRNGLEGVPVMRAIRGLPAERAGVQGVKRDRWGAWVLGDIIVGINNESIANYDDLLSTLEAYKIGEVITLHINRDGKKLSAELKLAAPQ